MHGLFFTPKAEELREFMRDKLGFPFTDTGKSWLVFDVPQGDFGCHPSETSYQSISFYCDDIRKTVRDLESRGVEFVSGVEERSWGFLTHFKAPGNLEIELYQPKYKKSPHVAKRRSRKKP